MTDSALIGLTIELGGQWYELVRVTPHTRVDGSETFLLAWRSACDECGEAFEITTSRRVRQGQNRRCPAHKNPAKWRNSLRKGNA